MRQPSAGIIGAVIKWQALQHCHQAIQSYVPEPPSGALWLHEIKHDGFRVI